MFLIFVRLNKKKGEPCHLNENKYFLVPERPPPDDNTGLNNALNEALPVLPIFIFDTNLIEELSEDDARISFIYNRLSHLNKELQNKEAQFLF